MLIRLKNSLIRERCMTTHTKDLNKLEEQIDALPYKMPHMTEKFDESWREMEHPDLHKHAIYHLAKAVGRVNLSPVELVKNYTGGSDMTAFVLDEKELLKLREDILKNPEKYEAVVT